MKKLIFILLLGITAFTAQSQSLYINKYLKDSLTGSGYWYLFKDTTHTGQFGQVGSGSGGGSGGSGTVNSGAQYRIAYYATAGTTITNAPAITGGRALISDANGVPTQSTATATQLNYISGATGTTGTSSTNLVFSTSPTLVTPILGTPQSITLTNGTGLPLSTGVTGTLQATNFPAISGDITISAGSLTAAITAGAIVNADVNASAAIAQSKILGLPDSLLSKNFKLGWYNVLDYGLVADGVTDNTDSLQALLNMLKSTGVKYPYIYFPNGHYIFSGSLKTTDIYGNSVNNAQVYIPLTEYDSSYDFGMWTLVGETPPNHFGNFSLPGLSLPGGSNARGGVLLESTTLDAGAFLGTAYETTTWGSFNFNKVHLENIHIRVRSKTGSTHVAPTMGAIDASNLSMFTAQSLRLDTQSPPDSSVTPASTSFGLRMPQATNWGQLTIDDIYIQGLYTGLKIGEHTVGKTVWIHTAYRAVEFGAMYHPAHFDRLLTTWSRDNIYLSGNSYVNADQWDIEDYIPGGGVTSRWYDLNLDLNDASGTSFADLKYFKGVSGVGGDGTVEATTNTSSPNIILTRIGTTTSSSSDTARYITIEDSHIENSQAMRFDPTTKRIIVSYNDSLWYFSPVDSAAITPAIVYSDDFTRADASTLGDMAIAPTTTTYQYANSAAWHIVSNKAQEVTSNASGTAGIRNAYVETTTLSDATVKCNITYSATQTQVRVITRYQDESNYIFAAVFRSSSGAFNQIQLYKLVSGSFTQLGSTATVSNAVSTEHEIKIVTNGSSIEVFNDGASVITATDGALSTQTKHGFGTYKGAGDSLNVDAGDTLIDDFSIQ